ncbi:hypothetical protein [Spartinivicinus poritis]|uniref:Uncharacterized protein n=1 Tax=Spartinivicinus poritis TaxID=2994640 RepID=A0ABT5UB70_9GAMM|nr:hypothetical protein [Spartinivicinus sp. A2-2]MDE1463615.1 hypothetical protein [Spartinivicinus sp. A2-2]
MNNSDIAAVASISDSIETNYLQSNYQIISSGAVIYHQSNNIDLISDDSRNQSLFGKIEYGLTIIDKNNDDTAKIAEFFQSTPTVDFSVNNTTSSYLNLTNTEYSNLSCSGDSDYLLIGVGNETLLGNDSYDQEYDSRFIDPLLGENELASYQIGDLVQAMASFNQRETIEVTVSDGGLTDIDKSGNITLPTVSLSQ